MWSNHFISLKICGRSEGTHVMTTTTANTERRIACHTLTLPFCRTKILIVLGDNSVFRGTSHLSWTVRKAIKLPWDFEDGVFELPPDGMARRTRPENAKSNASWIRHATRCMLPHRVVDSSLLIRTRSVRAHLYHPAARQQHRNVRHVICSSSRTASAIHALKEKENKSPFSNVLPRSSLRQHTKVVPSSFWSQTFTANTLVLLVLGN